MADEPIVPAILASDNDRERSIEQLSTAVSEGRLSLEEFSERAGLAQVARTQHELAVLTRDLPVIAPEPPVVPEHTRHLAVCSKLVRRGPWKLAARSSFRCIFGTVLLDLSDVRLSSFETELEIYNLFGTVTVIVPDGVQISVSGGGLFATQHINNTPARSSISSAPRLRINARGPGGTLYVRNPGELSGHGPRQLSAHEAD